MRSRFLAMFALLAFQLGPNGSAAHAGTTVQVLQTHPKGENITLPLHQNFHLLLAYSTDKPAGIWIAPYFQGKRVNAGSSPSQRYSGEGKALAWFFFMQPGDQVDEIRITAGDGGTKTTPWVATYPVHVVGGSEPAAGAAAPSWVRELGEHAELVQQQALQEHMNRPVDAGETALFGGFMLAMLGVAALGFLAPAWMLRRWQGGWRIAAALPATLMAFVVLRIVVGVSLDPTSHNLWPFEILIAGASSAGTIGALLIARRFIGANGAA